MAEKKKKDRPLSKKTIERLLKEAEPGVRELDITLAKIFHRDPIWYWRYPRKGRR